MRMCSCGHREGLHYDTAGRCMGKNSPGADGRLTRCGCTLYRYVPKKRPEKKP